MWDKLFSSISLLQKGMEASWTRNAVIRNNIANVETPGFKSSDVEFESIFAGALEATANTDDTRPGNKVTRDKHIRFGAEKTFDFEPRIVKNEDTGMLFNENNVDVEAENVKLAQNSLYYNTLLAKMNGELTRIKMAVREGK